jgi:hypothetical protein
MASEMAVETASETASEIGSKMASETSSRTFATAFSSFQESTSLEDALAFQGTSLEDVRKSLEEIQLGQKQRKSLHNVGRVGPFLKSLESYSKAIEVFCNGTPYLPWLWVVVPNLLSKESVLTTSQAPIKLMLQVCPST